MPGVALTLAINGYDDGASTGEVRRFLGDALGPSDFRKNASRLATALRSCAPALVRLLDRACPTAATIETVAALAADLAAANPAAAELATIDCRPRVAGRRAAAGVSRRARAHRPSVRLRRLQRRQPGVRGRLPACGRRFNAAVDDYAALVGLRAGRHRERHRRHERVPRRASTVDGRVLGSEADIVDATAAQRDRRHLPDRPPARRGGVRGAHGTRTARTRPHGSTRACASRPALNPRLAARIADADLLDLRAGTQHSSLFPSYLTPGLTQAIAANLRAIKLLITNIQTDAEIAGSSAVDIIERAVFYLKEKGRRADADAGAHHAFPDERSRRLRRPTCRTCRLAASTRCRIRGSCASASTRRA